MKGYVTIEEGCVARQTTPKPTVSVIVPTYNTQAYLDQALDSIEAQTLKNIEIICVNDGSTDGSLAIMEAHQARDSRIRIIDKENGGYGSACNRGIAEARGTWIAIVEPDDWIEPTMYDDMVAFANTFSDVPDMVKTPYWRVLDPDTENEKRAHCSFKRRVHPKRQPFTITDPGVADLMRHHPSIWSALYRRDFLERFDIRFPEIPGAGWADNPFFAETYVRAERIVYLDRQYYCYREETHDKTVGFSQRNTFVPIERWNDILDVFERVGMDDPSILQVHYRRGFAYLNQIGAGVDLERADVQAAMAKMFERMDDDLVFSNPMVSPGWKERYAKIKGIEAPGGIPAPYILDMGKAAFYNLLNAGPANTAQMIVSYLTPEEKPPAPSDENNDTPDGSVTKSHETERTDAPYVKLSIVIPVYNSGAYLDACLDSLAQQTFRDFEIVCVDDGSSDGSAELLAQWAKNDNRLRIIEQQNGGPSSARNTGIRNATGDYVVFLDADDLLEMNACETIARELAANNVDVLVFGWSSFPARSANHWIQRVATTPDALYETFDPHLLFGKFSSPYLRLAARRSLLTSREIYFDENLHIGEDKQFLFALYARARGIKTISKKLYRYRLPHAGSIMNDAQADESAHAAQDLAVVESVFADWKSYGLLERFSCELVTWSIRFSLYTILRRPEPARTELLDKFRALWLEYFDEAELRSLDIPAHNKELVSLVLDGYEDIVLPKVLRTWRIAEYGIGDLAQTMIDKILRR